MPDVVGDPARDPARDPAPDLDVPPDDDVRFSLVSPARVPVGVALPIVVRALTPEGEVDAARSGWLDISVDGTGSVGADRVLLRRGVGSVTGVLVGGPVELAVDGDDGAGTPVGASDAEAVEVGGELPVGETRWSGIVRLTGETRVPVDGTLVVAAGTVVLAVGGVNLVVDGTLQVEGTDEAPVLFAPSVVDQPWGGVVMSESATIVGAMFVGAGADTSRAFGHSNSQAVLFGDGADVTLRDVVIQDCPGKAMGARGGQWLIERSLVTRTDTGGEFEHVAVTLRDSHYLDFPEIDPAPRDDDNDAIYLLGDPTAIDPPRSRLERVTFIRGADDGIDHNGSTVEVVGCWIEGFDNEGIAASSGGRVGVSDTVITGCAQGLEAGYGGPLVEADHVLVHGCGVGLRFGDNYTREYTGELRVTDSVIQGNLERAVWNWVLTDERPRDGAVQVSTSLLDADEAEGGEGNVVGVARWTDDLMLAPESPGQGIASDGGNPGLLTPRPPGPVRD